MKKGVLLLNLGTPDDCSKKAIRRYLKIFLSDPRVITLPFVLRWILLYCFILPFRPKSTQKAYQAIWQKEGSPLLIHSNNLVNRLQKRLSEDFKVVLGMRYGNPSINSALHKLNDCQHLTILPLFPQYASSTTGSAIEAIFKTMRNKTVFPSIKIIRDFYHEDAYIQAKTALIKQSLKADDFLLLSYHGLPENHLKPLGCETPCQSTCKHLSERPACYRAQCYATSQKLQTALNLKDDEIVTTFQSRLGKTPWIKPYTDEMLKDLRERGIKNLAIACPAFVSDCLETLEEIGLRAKEDWLKLGGERFTLIPCLNDDKMWVDTLASFITC